MSGAEFDAIFCDDVRPETGNKLSFMGVYGGNLLFGELPATIGKICAVMTLRLPRDTAAQSATFRLTRDDETIGEATLDVADARRSQPSTGPADADLRLTIRFIAQTGPLTFDAPCRLQARAVVDGEALPCVNLLVDAQPAGASE